MGGSKKLMEHTLTQEQAEMIRLLIQGETITYIADRIGVARQTIYDWKNKDIVKFELDRCRRELTNQGNALITKSLKTCIDNIFDLACDKTDKRVALAANQYLINRVYGSPTNNLSVNENSTEGVGTDIGTIEKAIEDLKCNHTEGTEIIMRKANKLDD
ncbi:helix-turn-helix domain-containing protein [Metaclostridioides mangenotii]|uniref:helix-turn-helix domain-containing protein n=1 Tax=Metaclostridioides mangenotii TaxID=1540 RepID=UPI00080746F8|nr:helix-turn-helix domain-containing protein [Clostridioides mangenotii]